MNPYALLEKNTERVVVVCCWQDWALGVLHAKIIAAITLMGPQWWLKTVIEQVSHIQSGFQENMTASLFRYKKCDAV